uniref:FGLLP motif-containing membrane protein n=1 Tax=Herbidospora sakaeratensis TaxID=564415 RepID=UPI000781E596|nr:FGLLP motif-containing membrane protein [Herbidospora sakaeratensis]
MRTWVVIGLGVVTSLLGPAAADLTLTPRWGVAGTMVRAEPAGGCEAGYSVSVDGAFVEPMESDPSSVRFAVPGDAVPGPRQVTIRCLGQELGDHSGVFTVVTAAADVAMAMRGSTVTVRGDGYRCAVRLVLAGTGTDARVGEKGDLTASLTVPEVEAGHHVIDVVAHCPEGTQEVARIPLGVVAVGQAPSPHPGSAIQITGAGFSCGPGPGAHAGPMRVTIGGTRSIPTSAGPDGTFVLTLPEDLAPGTHRISAFCDSRPPEAATGVVEVPARPVLARSPAKGPAGSLVTVRGTRLTCANATLAWDGVQETARPVTVTGGAFTASVPVPADAVFGPRQIVLTCGGTPLTASFDVVPRTPRLDVWPQRAGPGAEVVVQGTMFDCGDRAGAAGEVRHTWGSATTGGDGGFRARVRLPRDAGPGPRTIRAWCAADERRAAQGRLTVTAVTPRDAPRPTPRPAPVRLRLGAGHGERGERVTLHGSGFACGEVRFGWAGRPARSAWPADGVFHAELPVPENMPLGRHEVAARCAGAVEPVSHEQYDVLPTTDATLELVRNVGPPGSLVTAIGRAFPAECTTFRLRFDDEDRPLTRLREVPAGGDFTVPDRGAGVYSVSLVCGGRATAAATYTIPEVWVRPAFATAVQGPGEVSWRLGHLAGSLVLGVLIVLLLGFPAEIFNKAYEHSRELGERSRMLRGVRDALGRVPVVVQFLVAGAAGAGLLTLVSPPDDRTLDTALGYLVAFLLTCLTYTVVNEVFIRWATGIAGSFRVLPGGLAVAAVCALGSFWLGLDPGYVYGIITVFVSAQERGAEEDRARAVLVAAVATLTLSLVAWLAWTPSHDEALRASVDPAVLRADTIFAAVFVMGVQSVLFGLIPLPFLDGYKLTRWSRRVWGVIVAVALFAFVHIVYGKESEKAVELDWDSVREMLGLFAAFAVASLAYWAFVRFRRSRHPSSR